MSSNTSLSPPPIETLVDAPSKARVKKGTTKKVASNSGAKSRPSWKEIIKACILLNKEDSRSGVARSTIKKYAEETYGLDVTGTNLYQLNRAITSGVESGIFVLPKGPSGKVKLAPKTKSVAESAKENSKPTSTKKAAATTKKAPASKKADSAAKKTTNEAKKSSATAPKKYTADKKVSTTTKKTAAPATKRNSPAKKILAGPSGKKSATKSASAKKTSSGSTDKKKVAAKEAASRAAKKPASKAKQASKKA